MACLPNSPPAISAEEKREMTSLMEEAGPIQYRGHIKTEADYRRKLDVYSAYRDSGADQSTASADGQDFPDNDIAEEGRLTEIIFSAMLSTEGATDASTEATPKRYGKCKAHSAPEAPQGTNSPQVALMKDTMPMSRIKRLTAIELELKAKELLYAIRDTQRGHAAMATWGAEIPPQEDFTSFKARFEAVVRSLKTYKTCTRSMLDPSYAKRLAAFPGSEERRKKMNADGNGKKQKRLAQQMDAEAEQRSQAHQKRGATQGSKNVEGQQEGKVQEELGNEDIEASGKSQETGEASAGRPRARRQSNGKGKDRLPTLMELGAAEIPANDTEPKTPVAPETIKEEVMIESEDPEASNGGFESDQLEGPTYPNDYY